MFVIAAAVVGGAYVIFGILAFGAALFTVPILSHFLPLDFVLPMCVLLDVSAALALGVRVSRETDRCELKWMVPFALARPRLGKRIHSRISRAGPAAPVRAGG